jgi:hypothetical protein
MPRRRQAHLAGYADAVIVGQRAYEQKGVELLLQVLQLLLELLDRGRYARRRGIIINIAARLAILFIFHVVDLLGHVVPRVVMVGVCCVAVEGRSEDRWLVLVVIIPANQIAAQDTGKSREKMKARYGARPRDLHAYAVEGSRVDGPNPVVIQML